MDEAGIQTFNTTTGNLTGSATTQYNLLIGDTNNKLTNVAPSATSGIPLISSGAAANPAFGTAVVAGGGTGNTTFTAYSVICAGTTATGAFQNVSGVGSSGQVLTSNGAGALPTWQAAPAGSAGMIICSNSANTTNTIADSTTYYLRNGVLASFATVSSGSTRKYINATGTITKVYGAITCNTGSNENVTLAIRKNDTTNTNVSTTIQLDASPAVFSNTGLSIGLVAGDFIDIILITPAWVTNPTAPRIAVTILIT